MTETTDTTTSSAGETGDTAPKAGPKKKAGGLNSLLLADLKSMAGGLGVPGVGSMKKAQLVDAIKAAQSGGRSGGQSGGQPDGQSDGQPSNPPAVKTRTRSGGDKPARNEQPAEQPAARVKPVEETEPKAQRDQQDRQDRQDRPERPDRQDRQERNDGGDDQDADQGRGPTSNRQGGKQGNQSNQGNQNNDRQSNKQGNDKQQDKQQDKQDKQDKQQDKQGRQNQPAQPNPNDQNDQGEGDLEGEGGRRNRRRRGRDRTTARPGGAPGPIGQRNEPDTTILEDDVLVPAAGILDVLDNYAFVRTSGYLPGVDDVYLSLSMVRKYGLRRGDAIVGQVRQPREGERKEKFNPMVRIDNVNGMDPESGRNRVDFTTMTPLHPADRLRLETDSGNLVGRVIDLAAPIGKGQRALIAAPPKAGKTTLLRSIANSITTNNPECHLMVVLIDERPEEVTEFERSVKGEVIASTFDRPPADHTMVAELAIERAKRLVELGHDVVVLLDGLTRLGRAYNLTAPANGRQLAGSVDSTALHPPKRFFGAARNLESGGSLTIIATALVETGSATDEVIFEEFQSAANMELWLRSELAADRLYPAVDAAASGTRREELLMGEEELEIVRKLRRALAGLESKQALELLLHRLRKSSTNIELLRQVQQKAPSLADLKA